MLEIAFFYIQYFSPMVIFHVRIMENPIYQNKSNKIKAKVFSLLNIINMMVHTTSVYEIKVNVYMSFLLQVC